MIKIALATTIKGLDKALRSIKKYQIVSSVTNMIELQNIMINTSDSFDLLIVSEKIDGTGSVSQIIQDIKKENPSLRIIYISSGNLQSEYYIEQYYELIKSGIYDIYYGNGLSLDKLINMIDNPKDKTDCQEISEAKEILKSRDEMVQIEEDPLLIADNDAKRDNVYLVTSVKPGTGKSFVSSNLACTLAKYGKTKVNGEKPRVLLVEGDLQTLSVSTLFGIKNDEFNLNKALDKINLFMSSHTLDDWYSEKGNDIKHFIDKCCIQTSQISNLYVMESHDFGFDEIYNIEPSDYYYLIDYLSSCFDLVVIDANSSLQHKTTDPLFQLSKYIYFVLTTDYNNVRLNIKSKNAIEELGVEDKTRYVLNKALSNVQQKEFAATFDYTDEEILNGKFQINYKIPLVDISMMYNSTYHHIPITLNSEFSTLLARIKFINIAKDIYPLENIDAIFKEINDLKKFVGKKK